MAFGLCVEFILSLYALQHHYLVKRRREGWGLFRAHYQVTETTAFFILFFLVERAIVSLKYLDFDENANHPFSFLFCNRYIRWMMAGTAYIGALDNGRVNPCFFCSLTQLKFLTQGVPRVGKTWI